MGQRAAIYCRVSTQDQSCERQERDLTAFATPASYEVVGVFKETYPLGECRLPPLAWRGDIARDDDEGGLGVDLPRSGHQ